MRSPFGHQWEDVIGLTLVVGLRAIPVIGVLIKRFRELDKQFIILTFPEQFITSYGYNASWYKIKAYKLFKGAIECMVHPISEVH